MTKNELILEIKETIHLTAIAMKHHGAEEIPAVPQQFQEDLINLMSNGWFGNMIKVLPTIKRGLENWLVHVESHVDVTKDVSTWYDVQGRGQPFFKFIKLEQGCLQTKSIHSDLSREVLVKAILHIYNTTGNYEHARHYVTPLQNDLKGLCYSLGLTTPDYLKVLTEMAEMTMVGGDYYCNITAILFELMRRRDILNAIGE